MKGRRLSIHGLQASRYGVEDLELPLGQLICLCGGVASGAHALAQEVLLGESRRRFLRALSPQEREQLGGLGSPVEMTGADGLPPAQPLPALGVHGRVLDVLHVRSDLARILRSLSQTSCPDCGDLCRQLDDDQAVELLQGEEAVSARSLVVAPMRLTQPPTDSVYDELVRAGFPRVLVEGQVARIDADDAEGRALTRRVSRLDVVIDRLVPSEATPSRLGEAIRNARAMAQGQALVRIEQDGSKRWFSRQFSCRACGWQGEQPLWDRWLEGIDLLDQLDSEGEPDRANETRLAGRPVWDLAGCSIGELDLWLVDVGEHAAEDRKSLIGHCRSKLTPALELGLGSIGLWRSWNRLAFGERTLLSVAVAIASRLGGLMYVVQHPLSGLDDSSLSRTLHGLSRLVEAGGTVVYVDAAPTVVAKAQLVIDLATADADSPTEIPPRSDGASGGVLVLRPRPRSRGGDLANLDPGLELDLPLGQLVCVDGPSGSGKSALLGQIARALSGSGGDADYAIDGTHLRRCIALNDVIDDARPQTLMQLLTLGRDLARLFAATPLAQKHQIPAQWFELERPGGRCARCEGQGEILHRLDFVEDLLVVCPECEGRRFKKEIFAATLRGASMVDLLEMTVAEAERFLHREKRMHAILQAATASGLGAMPLMTSTRSIDRLVVQRAVVAGYAGRADQRDLFLLERPGEGEHEHGARQTHDVLRRLVSRGATVLATRAQAVTPDTADWHLLLGPGSGVEGGRLVSSESTASSA